MMALKRMAEPAQVDTHRLIAIDGPAGSGKTTLALRLAEHFDLDFLDTGLLYRATARKLLDAGKSAEDIAGADEAARSITSDDLDPDELMTEIIGQTASKVAAIPKVRSALLDLQRAFGEEGAGAVLVGRDIGTVVRPDASHKIFVTASVEQRAKRRCKQLRDRGVDAIYRDVLEELCQRDARDQSRAVAPLVPAKDAFVLDTTDQTIDMAFDAAVAFVAERRMAI
jgi:cytidylate kinase